MRKTFIFALVVMMCFGMAGCKKNQGDSEEKTTKASNEAHMTVLEGKVFKIVDNDTFVLKVTKERSGYSIDDELSVDYKYIVDADATYQEPVRGFTLKDGDTVNIQFSTAEKKDGMDYVDCEEIAAVGTGCNTEIDDCDYSVNYGGALNSLKERLVKNNVMENLNGVYEDGSFLYFEFDSIKKIEDKDYYIINIVKEDKEKNIVFEEQYAVSCDNADVRKVDGETVSLTE
ncbi:MAG: hypothetical protein IKN54_02140 [Lachnospiraceae bacterium]|nr:hypothetical protein [Lachnospiraceae bacterium]